MSSIISLPKDILIEIFQYFDPKTMGSTSRVCKLFNEIKNEPGLSEKMKSILFLKTIVAMDKQIYFKNSIFSDELQKNRATKKITTIEWACFEKRIEGCEPGIYEEMKEVLIDALCDLPVKDLDKMEAKTEEEAEILKRAKNRVKGDIFIVPTEIRVVGHTGKSDPFGRKYGDYGLTSNSKGLYPSITVWATSCKSNNWNNYPVDDESFYIDRELPAELFKGKNEGDVVFFELKGKEVKLFCKQLSHRYGYDRFEDMFTKYVNRSVLRLKEDFDPPLSKKEQRKILAAFQETNHDA